MGAELGATTSVFPFDRRMAAICATGRARWRNRRGFGAHLTPTPRFAAPESIHDEIVEIDLSRLEPHIVGPHARPGAPVSQWPLT